MSFSKNVLMGAGAAIALAAASAATAAPIVLNFEGVNATYPSGFAFVNGYYNGGTSSDGTSGTNYGIAFSSNAQAICLNTPGTGCSNTSRGGLAPGSEKGGLFFTSGSQTIMDVAAGFDTGFSFFYAQPNTNGGFVNVYDDLGGAGNLLATISLTLTPSTCDGVYGAGYCPFVAVGVGFSGIAKSVAFGGVANFVVFDDITFGSITPGPQVPEPATWAMMIGGFGLTGVAMRRRNKKVLAAA